MYKYLQHLISNLKIAGHAFTDVLAHIIHGFIPIIKIKHEHGQHSYP
jgi:hypothetical protein